MDRDKRDGRDGRDGRDRREGPHERNGDNNPATFSLARLEQELDRAERAGDAGREAHYCNWIGRHLKQRGDLTGALRYYSRAEARAEAAGNRLEYAVALNNIGLVHGARHDMSTAICYHECAREHFRVLNRPVLEAHAIVPLVDALVIQGRVTEALAEIRTATTRVRHHPACQAKVQAHVLLGELLAGAGNCREALEALAVATGAANTLGDPVVTVHARQARVTTLVVCEQPEAALAEAQEGLALARAHGLEYAIPALHKDLGAAAGHLGRWVESRDALREAFEGARAAGDLKIMAEAGSLLARAHAMTANPAGTIEWAERAIPLFYAMGEARVGDRVRTRYLTYLQTHRRPRGTTIASSPAPVHLPPAVVSTVAHLEQFVRLDARLLVLGSSPDPAAHPATHQTLQATRLDTVTWIALPGGETPAADPLVQVDPRVVVTGYLDQFPLVTCALRARLPTRHPETGFFEREYRSVQLVTGALAGTSTNRAPSSDVEWREVSGRVVYESYTTDFETRARLPPHKEALHCGGGEPPIRGDADPDAEPTWFYAP